VLQFKKKALRVVSFSNRSDPNSTCQAGSKKGCGWPGWHKKMAAKGIKSLPEIKTIQYGSNPKPSGFENSIPPNPLVNHHVPMRKSPSLGSIPHFQHRHIPWGGLMHVFPKGFVLDCLRLLQHFHVMVGRHKLHQAIQMVAAQFCKVQYHKTDLQLWEWSGNCAFKNSKACTLCIEQSGRSESKQRLAGSQILLSRKFYPLIFTNL